MTLLIIDAPHFCAGVVTDPAGKVVRTAPIVHYMLGWPEHRVRGYCESKRWQATMRNEDLPAGAPMVFQCLDCGTPLTVPESYLKRPLRCPDCGGEWSQ